MLDVGKGRHNKRRLKVRVRWALFALRSLKVRSSRSPGEYASFVLLTTFGNNIAYISTVSGVVYDLELLRADMEGDASRSARSAMIALLFSLDMGKDKNSGPSVS